MDEKEKKEEPRVQVTDRRFWAQTEKLPEASNPRSSYPSFVEELKARTEAAEEKLKEKVQRLEEENEAFRLRLSKELERRTEQDKMSLFRDFLEVVDNVERALEAAKTTADLDGLRTGMELNLQLFLNKLESYGIERLELINQPFNPHEAEAVGTITVKDSNMDQRVAEVVQQGFRWGEYLLRPAQVRVWQYTSNPESPRQEGATRPPGSPKQ